MRLLHVFGPSPEPEVVDRAARVARGLPRSLTHSVDEAAMLPAFEVPGATASSEPLPLAGKVSLPRYTRIANAVAGVDLILTYGPGALDVLIARRIYGRRLPPLVHHEGDTRRLSAYDRLVRRLVRPAVAAVIGPDDIEDGIDLAAFSPGKLGAALPGLDRQRGDFVIGCISPLRSGLGIAALLKAATVIPNAKLVVIGGGPDAKALAADARRCGLGNRLVLPGQARDPARAMRQFDLLVVPMGGIGRFTLIEAMATGLPIVAPEGTGLPAENAFYENADGLRDRLLRLAGNRDLRTLIGKTNRARAIERHDASRMLAAYLNVYASAAAIDIR